MTYHGKKISIDGLGVAGLIEFFIRKGAHLFDYAVLGMIFLIIATTFLETTL